MSRASYSHLCFARRASYFGSLFDSNVMRALHKLGERLNFEVLSNREAFSLKMKGKCLILMCFAGRISYFYLLLIPNVA